MVEKEKFVKAVDKKNKKKIPPDNIIIRYLKSRGIEFDLI
jgi:hypothetical protein